VRELTVDVPESVWLEALKVNDRCRVGPGRIVFEKVRQKVQAMVCGNSDLVALANGECVHNDLVGEMVHVLVDRAFQILEIV